MDNLSVQLHTKPIGCSLGTTAVNHLIYADDLLLFAPSGKGLQTLLDCCYIYGCEYDVQFNASKSLIIYFDFRNVNLARERTLGRTNLNFATSCTYFGHVICNDLSDEADIQAKIRLIYGKSNILRQTFHVCSSVVKNKLFTAFFNNVYTCG